MAKFISFTKKQKTASGESEEIVFVNIDMVSTAKYRPDGTLSLTIHGTTDGTGKVEEHVLHGEEAATAVRILQNAK
jgi:hypothetical protein